MYRGKLIVDMKAVGAKKVERQKEKLKSMGRATSEAEEKKEEK